MLHTFIIPAYGEAKHLEDCIKSLQAQTVKSEIIITTGTPTEHIRNTADKYGIKLVVNQNHESIAGDWNFAFNTAATKYITLAHQDDIYSGDYVKFNLDIAERHNDVQIQFSDYSELKEDRLVKSSIRLAIKKFLLILFRLRKKGYASKVMRKSMLLFGCPICCPSVFYNKENLSNFSFSDAYSINLDWNGWLRMTETAGRFIYIDKKLMKHRLHAGSETSRNLHQRKAEDRKIFSELWFYPISRIISFFYSLSYSPFK